MNKTIKCLSAVSILLIASCYNKSNNSNSPTNNNVLEFTQISAGLKHTCATEKNGDAYCWGNHYEGAIGDGMTTDDIYDTSTDILKPTTPLANISVKEISADNLYTMALDIKGNLYGWGDNQYGQLATANIASSSTPLLINTNLNIEEFSTAPYNVYVIDSQHNLYAWGGHNEFGQMGINEIDADNTIIYPVSQVKTNIKFNKLAYINGLTACAISQDEQAYCWGRSQDGEVGTNTSSVNVPTKINMPTEVKSVKKISTGDGHVCAISNEDFLYCWGNNTLGQLGVGNTSSYIPLKVSDSLKFKDVAAVGGMTCAITTDGDVYCWGANYAGSLGDGITTQSFRPIKVTTNNIKFTQITAYNVSYTPKYADHNVNKICIISSQNIPYCWGKNSNGELGNGTTNNASIPTLLKK